MGFTRIREEEEHPNDIRQGDVVKNSGSCEEDRRNQNETTKPFHKKQIECWKEIIQRSRPQRNPEEHQAYTDASEVKGEDKDCRGNHNSGAQHNGSNGDQLIDQLLLYLSTIIVINNNDDVTIVIIVSWNTSNICNK